MPYPLRDTTWEHHDSSSSPVIAMISTHDRRGCAPCSSEHHTPTRSGMTRGRSTSSTWASQGLPSHRRSSALRCEPQPLAFRVTASSHFQPVFVLTCPIRSTGVKRRASQGQRRSRLVSAPNTGACHRAPQVIPPGSPPPPSSPPPPHVCRLRTIAAVWTGLTLRDPLDLVRNTGFSCFCFILHVLVSIILTVYVSCTRFDEAGGPQKRSSWLYAGDIDTTSFPTRR